MEKENRPVLLKTGKLLISGQILGVTKSFICLIEDLLKYELYYVRRFLNQDCLNIFLTNFPIDKDSRYLDEYALCHSYTAIVIVSRLVLKESFILRNGTVKATSTSLFLCYLVRRPPCQHLKLNDNFGRATFWKYVRVLLAIWYVKAALF